jgi:hypothetical protein
VPFVNPRPDPITPLGSFPARARLLRALIPCCILAGARADSGVPIAPAPRDWTWVQGAVFVPTNAVNEAEQWDQYDPAVNERELHFASVYGINVVRVFLHYDVYRKNRQALLSHIEDFLGRAQKYGIKTDFIFFDDCWNQPPPDILSAGYSYPAPIRGVHNSQWLVSPGADVQRDYDRQAPLLKGYVQGVVAAHRDDARIAFWEIYNEPNHSAETVRLGKDAYAWIKETGSRIPVTATGLEFSGGQYSDFLSWHEYGSYDLRGDRHALCTECMNRQGQSVPGVVAHFRGRTGFILWEFGIGRDNCRFAWSDNRESPRKDEPPVPFHGIVYPDGHPWSLADVRALLGPEGFERTHFFRARYYRDSGFHSLAKTSVVPFMDFELGNEAGTGSPDPSAGVPREHFSVRYDGTILAPAAGAYLVSVICDGRVEVLVDGRSIVSTQGPGGGRFAGTLVIAGNRTLPVEIRYSHESGIARLHVGWSGPGFGERILEPGSHFDGS